MSNWIQDFAETAQHNSTETMEYYDDIVNTREYNEPTLQDFRKMIDSIFNEFCFNNGLFNRVDVSKLNDTQTAILRLIGQSNGNIKNRYLIKMINYYLDKKDLKFNEFNFEEDFKDLLNDIYSGTPCVYVHRKRGILPKEDLKEFLINNENNPLIAHTSDFINIGKCIQFDVDGFPKNQLLYLICGIIICDVKNNKFKTFRELIQHILNYLHIVFTTKAFDLSRIDFDKVEGNKEGKYNLITFTEFKRDGKITENYRYSCAKKYFKNNETKGQTKYITDEKGSYILTEYSNSSEVMKKWESLENEYSKSGITDTLIKTWFDSQLLTRSTCLVGVLLMILKNGLIQFKKDEMPDWKAISGQEINDTYEKIGEIPNLNNLEINVKNVLGLLNNYVGIIKQMK